jgi:hypothetical protein
MANISKNKRPSRRDIAYFRQRQKNRVFTDLVKVFAEESERTGMTKKDWAELLEKDPSQITRWLSAPSNFELDTLSDILLSLGAEMDHRIVRFADRATPNYAHPIIAKCTSAPPPIASGTPTIQLKTPTSSRPATSTLSIMSAEEPNARV